MRAHRPCARGPWSWLGLPALLSFPTWVWWLWLATVAGSLPGVEALGWEQYLALLRSHRAGISALYFGSVENRLPRQWLAGTLTPAGVSVVTIPGSGWLESPLGGPKISAAQMQRFFGVTAGTVLFLDPQGMPLPQVSLPQALHQDDAQLLGLYLAYVAGGHYRAMTISEYAQALGSESLLTRAIARERAGCVQVLAPGRLLARARAASTGEAVDPWQEGGVFYLYTSDLHGRVFHAQLREILRGFATLHPRLTIITPSGADPDPGLIDDSCECVLAHAELPALRAQGPSPLLVVSARTAQGMQALRLDGFQPAPVLARLLGLRLVDDAGLDHDIPYGEVDLEAMHAGMGEVAIDSTTATPSTTAVTPRQASTPLGAP